MSRLVSRVGLPTSVVQELNRSGIVKCQDFYEMSTLELLSQTCYNNAEIMSFNEVISIRTAPKPQTALELYFSQSAAKTFPKLSTGSTSLNSLLKGGLCFQSITEVVGPPGVGKTQFCFGCCADAVLSKRGVIFIDTEMKFDPLRVAELVRLKLSAQRRMCELEESEIESSLELIEVRRPVTCKDLLTLVERLGDLIVEKNISLVVLDSIAALARKENLDEADKEEFIVRQSALLKQLASQCDCCVLVTNQILTVGSNAKKISEFDPILLFNEGIADAGGDMYRPALGPTWSHCVSTRIVMSRQLKDMVFREGENMEPPQFTPTPVVNYDRVMVIAKSPILGPVSSIYEIMTEGISVLKVDALTTKSTKS